MHRITKLVPWTSQWIMFTSVASTIIGSKRAPLGCGRTRDWQRDYAAETSATVMRCNHADIESQRNVSNTSWNSCHTELRMFSEQRKGLSPHLCDARKLGGFCEVFINYRLYSIWFPWQHGYENPDCCRKWEIPTFFFSLHKCKDCLLECFLCCEVKQITPCAYCKHNTFARAS